MGGGITNFLSLCLSDYLSAFYMLPAVYYTQKILFIGNITSQSHSSLSLLLIFHLTVYYNSIFLFQNCQTVMRPVRLLWRNTMISYVCCWVCVVADILYKYKYLWTLLRPKGRTTW